MWKLVLAFAVMFAAATTLDSRPDLVRDAINGLPAVLGSTYQELKDLQILVAGVLAILGARYGLQGVREQLAHRDTALAGERADTILGRAMMLRLALEQFTVQKRSTLRLLDAFLQAGIERADDLLMAQMYEKREHKNLHTLDRISLTVPEPMKLEPRDFLYLGTDIAGDLSRLHVDIAAHAKIVELAQDEWRSGVFRNVVHQNLVTTTRTIMDSADQLIALLKEFLEQRIQNPT
jgi:hypothetical protein